MLETIKNWLDGNWFSLLVALYVVGMMLYGHSRGFVRLAISFSAVFITAFAAKSALPHVTEFLKTHTKMESAIENYIVSSSGIDTLDDEQIDTEEDQQRIIAGLQIPKNIQDFLNENNRGEVWEKLGAEKFQQYVAGCLGRMMMGYIGFALLFVAIWILLHIFLKIVDCFTALPVIHGLNQISGAIFGIAEALIFVWIFFALLGMFEGTVAGRKLIFLIQDNVWLRFLYENNAVSLFLKGLASALL